MLPLRIIKHTMRELSYEQLGLNQLQLLSIISQAPVDSHGNVP